MSENHKRQRPFIFITLLFVTVAFLDRLIPEGMFSDGLVYATLSRNIAIGHGSMWNPYFGHASDFIDHPTLMFGIESLFFRILGHHYTTEKIFSFVVWLITVLLIIRLWKKTNTDATYEGSYWLPLLLWALAPTVLWSYPNNMLDAAMGVFDLLAIITLYTQSAGKSNILKLILASFWIFCASLTKGPVGLFPLALPIIQWLVFRKDKIYTALLSSFALLVFVSCMYLALLQFPTPRTYFTEYLDAQLLGALSGSRERVESSLGHFTVIMFLLIQLLPTIGFILLIFLTTRILKIKATISMSYKSALFFLLVGLSASLPIMISIKQRSFYTIPALPYLVISFALLIYPLLYSLITRYTLRPKWAGLFKAAQILAILVCIFYLSKGVGTVNRDHDIVHDTHQFEKINSPNEVFGVCNEMLFDFNFRAYTARYLQMESLPFYEVKITTIGDTLPSVEFFNSNMIYDFGMGSYALRFTRLESSPRHNLKYVIVNKDLCSSAFTDSLELFGYERREIGTWKYIVYQNTSL